VNYGERGGEENSMSKWNVKTVAVTRKMLGAVRQAVAASRIYEEATKGSRKLGITGEVGEVLCCKRMGLRLCIDPRSQGFDAVDRRGKRVQIKTRRSVSGGLPNDAGRTGTFSKHPFDYALLVILDRKYRLVEIWKAERERIWPLISRQKKRNPPLAAFKRKATRVWHRYPVG